MLEFLAKHWFWFLFFGAALLIMSHYRQNFIRHYFSFNEFFSLLKETRSGSGFVHKFVGYSLCFASLFMRICVCLGIIGFILNLFI